MAGTARLRVNVYGYVQGVGFRYFVQREGRLRGLTGFVRNAESGDCVEVIAEGERSLLAQLLDRLRLGPPGAVVRNVEVEWQTATGEFDRFQIRR